MQTTTLTRTFCTERLGLLLLIVSTLMILVLLNKDLYRCQSTVTLLPRNETDADAHPAAATSNASAACIPRQTNIMLPLADLSTLYSTSSWFVAHFPNTTTLQDKGPQKPFLPFYLDEPVRDAYWQNPRKEWNAIARIPVVEVNQSSEKDKQTAVALTYYLFTRALPVYFGYIEFQAEDEHELLTVDPDGHIVRCAIENNCSEKICRTATNGACLKSQDPPANAQQLAASAPAFEQVVSIAGHWGAETFHFPMEYLPGLMHFDAATLRNSKIHVTKRTSWTMQWLNLAGISDHQVIEGVIRVSKKLLVPKVSQCGSPSELELDYVANLVAAQSGKHHLDLQDPRMPAAIPQLRKTILYIQRSVNFSRRPVPNDADIMKTLQDFTSSRNMTLLVHSDQNVPSLEKQLAKFASADLIVAPHGAALSLLVASRPGTCVVEFSDPGEVQACFLRIAFLRHLNYHAIRMLGGSINKTQLLETMSECGLDF